MLVIPMCLSNIYKYKISIKTQPFIIKLLPPGKLYTKWLCFD